MEEGQELYRTIDYQFNGDYDNVIFLEDICNSLGIDVEKYWMRELDTPDFFTGNNLVTTTTKPTASDLYELTYSLLVSNQNEPLNGFAEYLIDNILEVWGKLEGCYKLEDSKKEDTE